MTLVLDKFRTLLPSKLKSSPSGWISFNAPCCQHRGHAHDTRKRGGIIITDSIVYNCFNCKYSTGWKPGSTITAKFKSLCQWLGANDEDIKQLIFEAMKTESAEYQPEAFVEKPTFTEKPLPEGALPLIEWLDSQLTDVQEQQLVKVVEYVVGRGYDPLSNHFYWSPEAGYADRVIIAFKYLGKIVGNTARKVTEGKPKYLSDQHPFFVFNVDEQCEAHRYLFVVEGPFDAISVGGVALLTNEISDQQARIINSIGKEVIVIPDQDKAGTMLIDQAKELGWSIAFPTWDDSVKDCADAVKKYGKLFVVVDAIKTATSNPAKIEIEKRKMLNKIAVLENQND
jgi:hypothetical protein